MECEEEEEVLLLLNFKEKIEQKFFRKSNMFFKIMNLETKKPFVQIGSHVFNGVYEDVLGTNLFFEEQDQPREDSIYDTRTPIDLEYIGKSAKVLSLAWQKIPDEIIEVDKKELKELVFRESYDTVLNKITHGSLDINDIVKRDEVPAPKNKRTMKKLEEEVLEGIKKEFRSSRDDETDEGGGKVGDDKLNEKTKDLGNRYNLLKLLVGKRDRPPEYYETAVFDTFNRNRDFSILKEIYLKSLDRHKISMLIDEKNIGNYVDVGASIAEGVIPARESNKLTDRDKQVLLSLDNFDNLSIPMKLILLVEHLKEEKAAMGKMSEEELREKDGSGRTAKDRYKLLKSLAKDLEYYLFTRIREKNFVGKNCDV